MTKLPLARVLQCSRQQIDVVTFSELSSSSFKSHTMTRTTAVITAPEPGIVVQPIHQFSDEQSAQTKELRKVLRSFSHIQPSTQL